MKVQQTIKKVGAVAASTLMVGMTMGAAQSLSDFPGMFTEDDGTPTAELVVGSEGQVADVVGAVNVAAALGQETVQTEEMEETVEGQTSETVNGGDYETDIRAGISESAVTATDYEGFERNFEYDSDDEISVTETATVDTSQGSADNTEIDHEGEVRVNLGPGDLSYTANFRPGVAEGESLYLMGDEYEVTSVDGTTEMELGSQMEHRDLDVGDSVEHGPFALEITDVDTEDSEIRVQVTEDGEVLDTVTMNRTSSDTFGDDDEFTVEVQDIWFGDQSNDIGIDTTYSEYTQEHDSEFVFDEDYDMTWSYTQTNGVTDVTLSNNKETVVLGEDQTADEDLDDDQIEALRAGESLAGPNDDFNFVYQGLTDSAMEDVDFSEDFEVEYTDSNGFDHTLALADDLHQGVGVTSGDSGYMAVDADEGQVPLHFDVDSEDIDSSGSGTATIDFEYGGYQETFELDTSADSADRSGVTIDSNSDSATDDTATLDIYRATPTGYGFEVSVAVVTGTSGHSDVSDGDVLVGYYVENDGNEDHFHVADTDGNIETDPATTLSTDFDASLAGNGAGSASGLYGLQDADSASAIQEVHLVESDEGDDTSAIEVRYDYTDEDSGSELDADIGAGQIGEVEFSESLGSGSGSGYAGDITDWEDGAMTMTNYGSSVNLASETSVSVDHPEEQRQVDTALGSVTEEAGEDQTVTYEGVTNSDIRGTLDDLSMEDSEVTQSVRDSSDLILVGGPAVNTLVADLASDGETWTVDEWNNNHQDEALVQLVEDAFTDGQHAMIVAGYTAEGTQAAAQYISNYAEHASELDGETQVTLSSGEYPGQ